MSGLIRLAAQNFGYSGSAMTQALANWIILHIPHNSTFIPECVQDQFVLTPEQLQKELLVMTDSYTGELYTRRVSSEQIIESQVSRLVVDVERFPEDDLEPMAERGMGAIYTSTHQLSALRRPITQSERQKLMNTWYHRHHERLDRAVSQALHRHDQCLIIDCHSYPSSALSYEINTGRDRPKLCIGTDQYHSPDRLVEYVESTIADQHYSVARNTPFSGSLVPFGFYQKEPRVKSLMLEVRRDLYMNEATGEKIAQFDSVARLLQQVIAGIHEGLLQT